MYHSDGTVLSLKLQQVDVTSRSWRIAFCHVHERDEIAFGTYRCAHRSVSPVRTTPYPTGNGRGVVYPKRRRTTDRGRVLVGNLVVPGVLPNDQGLVTPPSPRSYNPAVAGSHPVPSSTLARCEIRRHGVIEATGLARDLVSGRSKAQFWQRLA